MAGFSLGSFAGGIGQGVEQGQQIRARQTALEEQRRQQAAQAAAANWLQSLAQQPDAGGAGPGPTAVPPQPTPAVPPGSQGPPPQGGPPQGGMPQQVPMPGAQPMQPPPMAQGAPPAGPPMGGGAPAPQGGPPMSGGAPPMQRPQAGPPPGPQVSGTAAPTGDVFADSKKTLQSVARGIAQANPGRKWKPGELLDAVNDAVKAMDGINPMEKIAAQAQIAGSKAQLEYWQRETQAQDEQRKERADSERVDKDKQASADRQTKIDADMKRAKMTTDSREKVARLQSATRLQAAEIAQSGANERSDKLLEYRQQALDAGIEEKEWATGIQAGLKEQGLADSFTSKLFSAKAGAGQADNPPARPKVGGDLPAAPARGGQKNPAAAGGGAKPIPAATMAQWGKVPAQNKAAAKKHLAEQGYDVSGLN